MIKVRQKDIKRLVEIGAAIDVTNTEVPTPKGYWEKVEWSQGVNGANGVVVMDSETGQLYAVTARSSNLFQLL